jgi:hypothetical protein
MGANGKVPWTDRYRALAKCLFAWTRISRTLEGGQVEAPGKEGITGKRRDKTRAGMGVQKVDPRVPQAALAGRVAMGPES